MLVLSFSRDGRMGATGIRTAYREALYLRNPVWHKPTSSASDYGPRYYPDGILDDLFRWVPLNL